MSRQDLPISPGVAAVSTVHTGIHTEKNLWHAAVATRIDIALRTSSLTLVQWILIRIIVNRQCQAEDWISHKGKCRAIKKARAAIRVERKMKAADQDEGSG